MHNIFLGKTWHWIMIIVISGLLWLAGNAKLHVIHFNTFVVALLIGTVVVVLLVTRTTKPGEQVTRDVIEETDPDAELEAD
jgi:hypothetical protein